MLKVTISKELSLTNVPSIIILIMKLSSFKIIFILFHLDLSEIKFHLCIKLGMRFNSCLIFRSPTQQRCSILNMNLLMKSIADNAFQLQNPLEFRLKFSRLIYQTLCRIYEKFSEIVLILCSVF